MISTAELERTLEYLRAIYPERQAELEPLSERIRSSSGRSLADRSNSEGHLTVSGTVLHVRTGRVLLLHHRALDRKSTRLNSSHPLSSRMPSSA